MAIFNPSSQAKKDSPSLPGDLPSPQRDERSAAGATPPTPRQPAAAPVAKESLIAANLTIEGKIEGTGHVRIAGQFKGDVNVKGDLTIERGARLNGGVRANRVTVAGDLEGNIESAERVELLDSAALNGDLKAGTLTVAAGSRIRGHIECGWDDGEATGGMATGVKEAKPPAAHETKAGSEPVS